MSVSHWKAAGLGLLGLTTVACTQQDSNTSKSAAGKDYGQVGESPRKNGCNPNTAHIGTAKGSLGALSCLAGPGPNFDVDVYDSKSPRTSYDGQAGNEGRSPRQDLSCGAGLKPEVLPGSLGAPTCVKQAS